MIVLVLEKVPVALRGELSRWCIEVSTGVFVGNASATVRELLFEKCIERKQSGRCVLAHRAPNEQGFAIRIEGSEDRRVVDCEGLQLVAVKTAKATEHIKRRQRRLPTSNST